MRAPLRPWILIALVGASCAAAKSAPDGAPPVDTAQVSISPATPHTLDDLHAVVANPSSESYRFRWSVDGAVRADLADLLTVPAADTHRDQKWQVDLLAGATMVS